jgi:ketosteroid isomerase-like protein
MSENLDLVRSIYADWERGDFSSVDWAHPGIEWVRLDGPEPGTWIGLAGVAAGFADWYSAWEDVRAEADECREIDDERVLALGRFSGRGRRSGVDLAQMRAPGANVFHVREGRVIRIVSYWDRQRALADLGMEE